MKKTISALLCFCFLSGLLTSCGTKEPLDQKDPITLTMWHVFGSQSDSPMNDMIDEFNRTTGQEKGVVIKVISVSNSSDIHTALLAAASGDAGAGSLPDLFFCYPETAKAIGTDHIVAWNELFSAVELEEYVGAFIEECMVEGKLIVFPVAKSSEALFLNATIFDRFSADTGVTYESLATWEGLFETAAKYFDWSGGKTFLMHDEILHFCQINTASLGGQAFSENNLNFSDPLFRIQWEDIAKAFIAGFLRVEDNYATTCMMTGEIIAAIGSTASILYFKDTVTYRDNTTEPLALVALPCPTTTNGTKMAIQQGVGLSAAVKGDKKKEAAALLFAKWITESEPNLRFVTQAGYMPVKKSAFDAIVDFPFENDAYRGLYETMDKMRREYAFYIPPVVDGYYDILLKFFYSTIEVLTDYRDRYETGQGSLEDLAAESFETLRQVMVD